MSDPTSPDSRPARRIDFVAWAAFLTAMSNLITAVHGWW